MQSVFDRVTHRICNKMISETEKRLKQQVDAALDQGRTTIPADVGDILDLLEMINLLRLSKEASNGS